MKRSEMQDYERIYKRSLLVMMLGTLGVYTYAATNPVLFVLGAAGVLMGWWRATRGAATAPREMLHVMTGLVVAAAVVYALRYAFTVESFAFFCILLLVLKLFDLRTPRDHGQLIVLCLGFLIAASLTSSSMLTGLGVFVMTLLLTRTTLLFRLYASSQLSVDAGTKVTPRGVLDIRAMQIVVGFCCVVLAGVVFLVMPRNIGGSSLGSWGGTPVMESGFTSEVELGRPGRITSSPTPIMRVRVRDRDDRPLGAPRTPAVYLRGAVLGSYDGGTWSVQGYERQDSRLRARAFEQDRTAPVLPDEGPIVWTHEYEITMDRPDASDGYLFSPWLPVELRVLGSDALVSVDERNRSLKMIDERASAYKVRVRETRFEQAPPGEMARSVVSSSQAERVPAEVVSLAQEILSDAGLAFDPDARPVVDDARAVRAFEAYLRDEFAYSLESEPVPRGMDATAWFVSERRVGHCEYFASALALMCRASGIPSRVVAGYVVAEFNEVSGTYVVRQSNAHAWVEASIGGGMWKVFDGTPTGDFQQIHEGSSSAFDVLTKVYDAVQHQWIRHVVGYDDDRRAAIFGRFDPDFGLGGLYERLSARFAAGRGHLVRAAFFWSGVVFISTMLLGIGAAYAVQTERVRTALRALRRRLRSLAPGGAESDAATLARRIDDRFAFLGAARDPARPMDVHRRESGAAVRSDGALVRAVAALNRFRHGPDSTHKAETLREALAAIERVDASG